MRDFVKDKKLAVLIPVVFGLIAIITIREFKHQNDILILEQNFSELEKSLEKVLNNVTKLQTEKEILEEELGQTVESLEETEKEKKRLDRDVRKLEEIIETDSELLGKYSKVSFLNEHYVPKKLDEIDEEYVVNPEKEYLFLRDAYRHLRNMLRAAKKDDIDLKVVSAYRSFETQADLKYNYLVRYGSGANTFSADQGYSEHQLGTTVDLSTAEIGNNLSINFEKTQAFKWLEENAYKFGFIMSYPKNNQYYQYEPWHWRFVSRDLAERLYERNESFYNLDQRQINKYLEDFFD